VLCAPYRNIDLAQCDSGLSAIRGVVDCALESAVMKVAENEKETEWDGGISWYSLLIRLILLGEKI
jgi:hypothetical protein